MGQLYALVVLVLTGAEALPVWGSGVPTNDFETRQASAAPLSAFEENRGQFDADVRLACRTPNYTILVTATALVVRLDGEAGETGGERVLRFALAPQSGELQPFGAQPARMHYFFPAGASFGHLETTLYAGLRYENVEQGVDLQIYCGGAGLEYEWLQRAGTGDPARTLPWEGADGVMRPRELLRGMAAPDNAVAAVPAKAERRPRAVIGGSSWDSAYAVAADRAGNVYITGETWSADFPTAMRVAGRRGKDVFIAKLNGAADTLLYTAIIGGLGDDAGKSIAVDASGNVFVAGTTDSPDFPISAGAAGPGYNGERDAFVLKLDATGSRLVYATYIGGSGEDSVTGIALDAAGAAYVTGYTASWNFPATGGALQTIHRGGFYDAFLAKINPDGRAFGYSTLLGGSGTDTARAVAVDGIGCAYVTGATDSANFPMRNALQASPAGGGDAFVAKANAAGSALVYSTYLGGRSLEYGSAIAVDASGNAYVAGTTLSPNFPMGPTALRRTNRGNYDAFVAALNPTGTGLTASTYLGGSDSEEPAGIAVDASGFVYVAGYTRSGDFLIPEAGSWPYHGGEDGFLVKLGRTLDALLYTECLGGGGDDRATSIAVGTSGQVLVAGRSASRDFPGQRIGAGGAGDAFVVRAGGQNHAPVTVSITPASGSGLQQVFHFTAADPDGATDLLGMMILISPVSGGNGCVVYYDRASGLVALADDALAFPWAGYIGTAGIIENKRCSVALGGASASASGINLSLTLPVTFKSGFAGRQVIAIYTQDRAGAYAGWDARGSWEVPSSNRAPSTISVTPSAGSGASQTFTFIVADPDGAEDLLGMMILVSPATGNGKACLLYYNRAASFIALADDSLAFPWAGYLGTAGMIENDRCSVALGGASASVSGTNVSLKLPVTFKSGLTGRQTICLYAQDRAGAAVGWDARGSWDVPAGNRAPSTISVTPSAGSGVSQTFTFRVADPDGAADLLGMMILISPAAGGKTCLLYYNRAAGFVALADDGFTFPWAGYLGTTTIIENSQCAVSLNGAFASAAGDSLALTLPLTFRSALRGVPNIALYTEDRAGAYAGWDVRGSWNVP